MRAPFREDFKLYYEEEIPEYIIIFIMEVEIMLREAMKATEPKEAKQNGNEILRLTSLGAKSDAIVKELIEVMRCDHLVETVYTAHMGKYTVNTYVIRDDAKTNADRSRRVYELVCKYLKGQYQIFYRGGNFCYILITEQWK